MTTLFISDLHLDDSRPETTDLLQAFLQREAVSADALYILGDLFEYWLGDDVPSACSISVFPESYRQPQPQPTMLAN